MIQIRGIVKLTCDGTVVEDRIPGPTKWGYNIGMVGNKLHIPLSSGIEVWDVCQGTLEGTLTYTETPNNSWGFAIGVNEMFYYRTTGWVNGGTNKIIRGNLDGSGSETVIYDNGETWGAFMGITQDASGNIYVVRTANDDGTGNSIILKISPTGTFLGESAWDGTLTQIDGQTSGYNGARGIAWSPLSNQLYVGSNEDCLAVFDTALNYIPAQSIGYVTGSVPKGVSLLTECCPTNNNIVVDTTLCAATVNDVLSLQELINCNGTICEGLWSAGIGNSGLNYDPCDNSVTITSTTACGTFTLESDISVENVTAPIIAGNQSICAGTDPAAFTVISAATGSGTIQYRHHLLSSDCLSSWCL